MRISQETFSKWAELTVLTVIKVESGRTANPSLFTIKKLTNALGVTVDDLLY
ncbi:helix-turn-helix transcriptional regulator [Patescibacteria group bacterium]|nr:helix-turn-helix transcriptional regulator [Patescibacteria group bacterium]